MTERSDVPPAALRAIYETMVRIRRFEDAVAEGCLAKKVVCPAHLYTGQEAVAAGVCANLRKDDYVFGTHRGHGVYIAKGGDLRSIMAEIFGRSTGCSKGKGGSMHVIATDVGLLGTSSIVGGIIPLSVGAALASKLRREDRVTASFFGDGAADEGVFHECLNFASLHDLPVIFIVENNQYSSHLHIKFRQPRQDIVRFAEAHNLKGLQVDGNDPIAVYKASRQAVERARKGKGPTLVECFVNRWRGHVGPNWDYDVGLRTKEQVDDWKRNCPIDKYEEYLLRNDIISEKDADAIVAKIDKEVQNALKFAEDSPYPAPEEVLENVYRSKRSR